MFAMKAITPILSALDEIEAMYRDGKLSREELEGISETMYKITGEYYWRHCMEAMVADWVERYKTLAERAQEKQEQDRADAERKAKKEEAAELARIEAAKPRMIEDLRGVNDDDE